MSREVKRMTLKALKSANACEEGMEWITPLIEAGDIEAVKIALCNEKPSWAQWAYEREFDVLPEDASERNGATVIDGRLVFVQTAGGRSTQTAGGRSTQTAGRNSTQTAGEGSRHKGSDGTVAICRYWQEGRYFVATKVLDSDEFFWSYNVESDEWEHSVDQSDPVSKDVEK